MINPRGYWRGADAHLHHGHSEELGTWIVNYLKEEKTTPIFDFGCGLGYYLSRLKEAGFEKLTGYEGEIPHHGKFLNIFDNIKQHDLTFPLDYKTHEKGNIICLEVGEHIPGHFQHWFLENLTQICNNKLILSWAVRGQPGHGHFHCLNNEEVIISLEIRGFVYLKNDTISARSSIVSNITPWFKNTLMVFQKL